MLLVDVSGRAEYAALDELLVAFDHARHLIALIRVHEKDNLVVSHLRLLLVAALACGRSPLLPGTVSACTSRPVHDVENAPVNVSSPNYDLSNVTKAIQSAGIGLGWQMKEKTPGHIVGSLYLRSHVAVVDVTYTLDEFSINYKDSTNLNYDGTVIHKNYNSWIQNLTNAINVQLAAL